MFSVVVPTMWRFAPFNNFLKALLSYREVGEVILINNDAARANNELIGSLPDKLRVFDYGENIGVNPAWNLGALEAKYPYICFLNDDVIFDLSLFDKVKPYLKDRNTGVLGLCPGVKDFNQPLFRDGNIDITPWNGEHTYGFGCLMFIARKNFIKIPEDMNLYFGDNFIFDTCLANRKINYNISNIVHFTPFAVTTTEVGAGKLDIEKPLYDKHITDFRWGLGIFNHECGRAMELDSDIKPLLPILYDYAYKCNSVLELGVRTGNSTRVFLNANLRRLTSVDIQEDYFVRDLFNVATVLQYDYNYIIADSLTYIDDRYYDMLFIDTDHTYDQLKAELNRYHRSIDKYIIIHDVCTYGQNLMPAIMEFMVDVVGEWMVDYYTTESNGLCILKRYHI